MRSQAAAAAAAGPGGQGGQPDAPALLQAALAAAAQEEEGEEEEQHQQQAQRRGPEFKGFGAPPRELQAAGLEAQSLPAASGPTPQQAGRSAQLQQHDFGGRGGAGGQARSSVTAVATRVPALRVFLYAADAKETQEAIRQAGWDTQVVISEDLRSAHVVVAAKQGRTGKHHKLQQGERTARNSKIPFVCVGRRMSRDNLVLALAPVLQAHRAKHGVVDEDALAAAVEAAGVSPQRAAQHLLVSSSKPDLQPGWRERRLAELGLLPNAFKDVEQAAAAAGDAEDAAASRELALA